MWSFRLQCIVACFVLGSGSMLYTSGDNPVFSGLLNPTNNQELPKTPELPVLDIDQRSIPVDGTGFSWSDYLKKVGEYLDKNPKSIQNSGQLPLSIIKNIMAKKINVSTNPMPQINFNKPTPLVKQQVEEKVKQKTIEPIQEEVKQELPQVKGIQIEPKMMEPDLVEPPPERKRMKDGYPSDLSRALKRKYFTYVETTLQANRNLLPKTIKDTYGAGGHFPLLVNFTKAMTTIEPCLDTIEAIYENMQANNQVQPRMLITLIDLLHSEVLDQPHVKEDVRIKGEQLLVQLRNALIDSAAGILSNYMQSYKYLTNGIRKETSNLVAHVKPDINSRVMDKLINLVFDSIPAHYIFENINTHEHLEQRIAGLVSLYTKLKEVGHGDDKTIQAIAAAISQIKTYRTLIKLDDTYLENMDAIVDDLPACLRNAYFTDVICLFSRVNDEYVFAANSTYNFDDQRRRVFAWSMGAPPNGSHWLIDKVGEYVHFKNRDRHMEYLYAADLEYNNDLRNIFTWIPGGNTGTKVAWLLETKADYCFLKNVFFNEYLFSSIIMEDNMRHVFTWKAKEEKVQGAQFEWEIRPCN